MSNQRRPFHPAARFPLSPEALLRLAEFRAEMRDEQQARAQSRRQAQAREAERAAARPSYLEKQARYFSSLRMDLAMRRKGGGS